MSFVDVCLKYCKETHSSDCLECSSLVGVAKDILENELVEVSSVFRKYFPKVQYQSSKATRRLMQLSVVVFNLFESEKPSNGKLYLMEQKEGVDYGHMINLMRKAVHKSNMLKNNGTMTKELLRGLCQLASTESDRKLINFAVCESQGLSSKKARSKFGIHNYSSLQTNVYEALDEA